MPDSKDRRQYVRFQVPGAIVSDEPHGFLQRPSKEICPVLNLSKGGLGFETKSQLKSGQKLTVLLTSKEETLIQQIPLQTQVIYCIPHSGMPYDYHVGVVFAPFAGGKGCNSPEVLKVFDQLEKEYAK